MEKGNRDRRARGLLGNLAELEKKRSAVLKAGIEARGESYS